MERVGVRELKNRATQILRVVREDHAEYLVTVDGEPVAVLRPCDEADLRAERGASWRRFLDRMEEVAERIGAEWQSEKGAVELLSEIRDDVSCSGTARLPVWQVGQTHLTGLSRACPDTLRPSCLCRVQGHDCGRMSGLTSKCSRRAA